MAYLIRRAGFLKRRLRTLAGLVSKDFRLLVRDRVALLFLLLAPVVVISVAGLSLATFYGGWERENVSYLFPVADLDDSELSNRLVSDLEQAEGLELLRGDEQEARRLVGETNRAGAALLIPKGFGSEFQKGKAVRLTLWVDPVKHIEVLKIKGEIERVRAALVATQIAGRIAVVEVLTHAGDVDFEAVMADATRLAEQLIERSVGLDEISLTSSRTHFNTFDQNVPGFGVTFLLLGMLLGVGTGLADERDWGMFYRLSASPVSVSSLITGKVLSRFSVGVVQMVILFTFGRLAFAVSLGPSWLALGLVIAGISFAAASLGLLVAAISPSRDAVLPLGTIAIMGMAAIGGCWWPMTIEPLWVQNLAHLFPTAWAMEAFNDLMLRERTLVTILPAVGALTVFGTVYFVLGLRILLRREAASP
jgi:ABC-2 type transport system permease protein